MINILVNKVKNKEIELAQLPKDTQIEVQAILDEVVEDKQDLTFDLFQDNQPMMFAMRMLVNKQVDMSEEELLELIDIYDEWKPNLDVKVEEYYKYQDNLYKVIQAHKTQVDWKPNLTPAMFNKVQPPSVIPIWVQPTGGHDAYKIGDKVTFNGKTYESKINANSWSPSAYPAGWKLI